MLSLSTKITCHGCDKNYCCVGQRFIEIDEKEFALVKPFITDEQLRRAKVQIDSPTMMNGMIVYDCPFNDPETGKCEIYDARFIVCAGYGVVSPQDDCNSKECSSGTMVVNPVNVYEAIKNPETVAYLMHMTKEIKPTTVMDEFRKLVS